MFAKGGPRKGYISVITREGGGRGPKHGEAFPRKKKQRKKNAQQKRSIAVFSILLTAFRTKRTAAPKRRGRQAPGRRQSPASPRLRSFFFKLAKK